jgi:hypothetical protein
MRVSRGVFTRRDGWVGPLAGADADLVLVFGATDLMSDAAVLADVGDRYPAAYVCGCSTAGEIAGLRVLGDSVTATAIRFEGTVVRAVEGTVTEPGESFEAGRRLAAGLPGEGLVHAFVLSDGLSVNGSALVNGITAGLPSGVTVTGGMAGDGARFGQTVVWGGGTAGGQRVVLLGFYGDRLRVGFGSMGGWTPFGTDRRVTRSRGNVLYELDGRTALDLYREYLGPHAAGLPASGLLFPLSIRDEAAPERRVVRTILGINESDQSLTFAGDVPEGSLARLMRSSVDRLVDGAAGAARACRDRLGDEQVELAVLISCVGRKLVLGQRVEEEVEAVADVLGEGAVTSGFYSYGEVGPGEVGPGEAGPAGGGVRAALHNQTMTITTFAER